MHLTSSPAIWYAARASGVAAYVVLTVTVALGMAMGGKAQSKRWPKFATAGRAPLRRPARRLADRRPRRCDRARLVPALLAAPARRPAGVDVPAALDGPRHRRRRAAARARDHEPLPEAAAVPRLAARPLPQLRGLGRRLAARHVRRHRPQRDVARDAVRGLDRERRCDPPLALRRLLAPLARRRGRRARGRRRAAAAHARAAAPEPAALELRALRRAAHGAGAAERHEREADRLLRRRRPGAAEAARARRSARLADLARRNLAPARVPAERRRVPRSRHVGRRHELQRPLPAAERTRPLGGRELGACRRTAPGSSGRSGCMRRALPVAAARARRGLLLPQPGRTRLRRPLRPSVSASPRSGPDSSPATC